MRTFVIGDIHGQYHALMMCLKESDFKVNEDRLIVLGDVCDRGANVRECIDELLKIKHLVYLLGNHDQWTLHWATTGQVLPEWFQYGGRQTLASYQHKMPQEHIDFLLKALLFFEDQHRLFVHAGFDVKKGVKGSSSDVFLWDREFFKIAKEKHLISPQVLLGGYQEIFIGHTPDLTANKMEPRKFCNVWAMDTGAGYGRMLTIMDVDSKQFWQAPCKTY